MTNGLLNLSRLFKVRWPQQFLRGIFIMICLKLRRTLLLGIAVVLVSSSKAIQITVNAQTKSVQSSCDRTGAFSTVQQQLAEAKGLEDVIARIKILTRAADLLWASQTETARAAFSASSASTRANALSLGCHLSMRASSAFVTSSEESLRRRIAAASSARDNSQGSLTARHPCAAPRRTSRVRLPCPA